MSEMRWDPIKQEWVVVATHRMERTFLPPPEYCPLCPTKECGHPTEIPRDDFDIVVFENRFPSFKLPPPQPSVEQSDLYMVEPSAGVCEVVVYTSQHQGNLSTLSKEKVENLIKVWRDRYQNLGGKEEIDYVLIFENRGEEVGVTLHHPHGQIYAFPYVPKVPAQELEAAKQHYEKTERCLFCDLLQIEENDGRRVVGSNNSFTAFVPFSAHYPFEVHIYSRNHNPSLIDLGESEIKDLASILQKTIKSYDNLFDHPFPYIMVIHQELCNNSKGFGHLHIEFYPPLRDQGKLKYLAGCEQGAGTFINDSLPEEKAGQLRQKFKEV